MNRLRGLRAIKKKTLDEFPDRVKPVLNVREFMSVIFLFIFFAPFLFGAVMLTIGVFPVFSDIIRGSASFSDKIFPFLFFLGFTVLWDGIVFWMIGSTITSLLQALKARKTFLARQSRTVAKILHLWSVKKEDQYGTSESFFVRLEFRPTIETLVSVATKYQFLINYSLYRKLLNKDTVGITYAIEDPRIFLIDGE